MTAIDPGEVLDRLDPSGGVRLVGLNFGGDHAGVVGTVLVLEGFDLTVAGRGGTQRLHQPAGEERRLTKELIG